MMVLEYGHVYCIFCNCQHFILILVSPQITNPGISCENEVCHNKVEFFEQYDTVSLTVYFKGNGPFNVSWFFNHRLLLPPVINTSKKDVSSYTSLKGI